MRVDVSNTKSIEIMKHMIQSILTATGLGLACLALNQCATGLAAEKDG
jgi:hypothetical protein